MTDIHAEPQSLHRPSLRTTAAKEILQICQAWSCATGPRDRRHRHTAPAQFAPDPNTPNPNRIPPVRHKQGLHARASDRQRKDEQCRT